MGAAYGVLAIVVAAGASALLWPMLGAVSLAAAPVAAAVAVLGLALAASLRRR